jgi:hypothetical protein
MLIQPEFFRVKDTQAAEEELSKWYSALASLGKVFPRPRPQRSQPPNTHTHRHLHTHRGNLPGKYKMAKIKWS